MITAVALCVVLVSLSALHVYWALGGRFSSAAAVPEVHGAPAFTPGPVATLAVALLLMAAALVCAGEGELGGIPKSGLTRLGVWVLAVLFALRAVGDFRLVGFFKRVRGTRFAVLDSRVYSPLCAAISALCARLLMTSGSVG